MSDPHPKSPGDRRDFLLTFGAGAGPSPAALGSGLADGAWYTGSLHAAVVRPRWVTAGERPIRAASATRRDQRSV